MQHLHSNEKQDVRNLVLEDEKMKIFTLVVAKHLACCAYVI